MSQEAAAFTSDSYGKPPDSSLPPSPPRSPLRSPLRRSHVDSTGSLGVPGRNEEEEGEEVLRARRDLLELREQNARAKEMIWTANARLRAAEQAMETSNLGRQRVGEAKRVVAHSPLRTGGSPAEAVLTASASPLVPTRLELEQSSEDPALAIAVQQEVSEILKARLQELEGKLKEAEKREQALLAELSAVKAARADEAALVAVLRGELKDAQADLEAYKTGRIVPNLQIQALSQSYQVPASQQKLHREEWQQMPQQFLSPQSQSQSQQQQQQQQPYLLPQSPQLQPSLQPVTQHQQIPQVQAEQTTSLQLKPQQLGHSYHLPQQAQSMQPQQPRMPQQQQLQQVPQVQTAPSHQPQVVIVTSSSLRSLDGAQALAQDMSSSPRPRPQRLRSAEVPQANGRQVSSDAAVLTRPLQTQQPLLQTQLKPQKATGGDKDGAC